MRRIIAIALAVFLIGGVAAAVVAGRARAYDRRGDVGALLNYESVLKSEKDLTVIRRATG